MSRLTLASVCADPAAASQFPPCRTFVVCSRLSGVAVATAGAGFIFLGILGFSAHLARTRPQAAARFFGAILTFGAIGVSALAVAHGLLLTIGYGLMGLVFDWWPSSLTLPLAGLVLVWMVASIRVAFSINHRSSITVAARVVDPAVHPALERMLRQTSGSLGAAAPDHVAVGLVPGIFLAHADVVSLDGRLTGSTLYLSLPFCRILSETECAALVAHEMAHAAGPESAARRRLGQHCAGVADVVAMLRGRVGRLRALAVTPTLTVLSTAIDPICSAASRGATAEEERDADRAAASLSSADAFGSALVKLHAFEPAWPTLVGAMHLAVAGGSRYQNVCALFAETVWRNGGAERLRGVGSTHATHPSDWHETLGERLSALGVGLERVGIAALNTHPADPASRLFGEVERLEQDLSSAQHRMVAAAQGLYEASKTSRVHPMASG